MHVIARLNVGGAALHVLQLAREQQRRGHDVLVVAGTLAEGEESMEYVADELGVHVLKLPALQRQLSLRADSAAIRALRGIIRTRRPDVLHTHTAKAGATGRIAALLAGSARPSPSSTPTTATSSAATSAAAGNTSSAGSSRVLAHATETLIAVSDEVRDDLVAFGVAKRDRFVVVPYGFDLPAWSEADERVASADPRRARAGRGDLRDRLGGQAHRDQAAARPRPHAPRGPGR